MKKYEVLSALPDGIVYWWISNWGVEQRHGGFACSEEGCVVTAQSTSGPCLTTNLPSFWLTTILYSNLMSVGKLIVIYNFDIHINNNSNIEYLLHTRQGLDIYQLI